MTASTPEQRIAELERQVALLKEQNAEAMRELDSFAYAVSHDLRAPLRSLSGFSQALLEGNEADAGKSRHYLERIQQASKKMSELIDALLSISRVSRAEVHFRDIDFSRLCSDAIAAVGAKYPDRSIAVEIAPGLRCFGDPRLVRNAVELLIDNAYKFTARTDGARIDIGVSEAGEFYIADNGAGFDPAYADKLFKPFQRLHAEPQFTGIGVGLATVHRIMSRHGGRIRIQGNLDGGATVFLALTPPQGTPNDRSS
jgi:signal transduction histidine kinase